jgi:branched-chain amino acid transport system substrate-binding protein
MALREINARGGILSRQLVIVPSGGDLVLDPSRFADSPAPLARYLVGKLQAKSVAIAARSMDEMRITPLAATPLLIEREQVDFSATVIRLKNSGVDALVVRLPTDESVRLLTELRQQAYAKPVLGEASLISARLIERAGDAANGVRAVVGLGAETPMPAIRDFQRKHRALYGGPSGLDAMRGYSALYLAKVVTTRLGRVDKDAFAAALKNLSLAANDEPGLLLDVTGDADGVLRHQTLVVEIRNHQPVAIDALSPQ